jgi:hypothetical protein
LGNVEYDRADLRAAILPHATGEDPDARWAARAALVHVMREPSDLAWWIEEARTAGFDNAEEVTRGLTALSNGVIRDDVATAVLHMLRDGTAIRPSFVLRGLRGAVEFDASVEARLIEVVRASPKTSNDLDYYFHFITPELDPKSDAVVDFILEAFDQGAHEVLRGLSVGLSRSQRDRAAARLVEFAENADADWQLNEILTTLKSIATRSHSDRISALGRLENLSELRRQQVEATAAAARSRPD